MAIYLMISIMDPDRGKCAYSDRVRQFLSTSVNLPPETFRLLSWSLSLSHIGKELVSVFRIESGAMVSFQ
jgi:hypothetical protein